MTRIYGFTHNYVNNFVVGFGKRCLCLCVYNAKVPKKRLNWHYYKSSSKDVVWNMKHNCDKFRFFGYVSIDKKDLMDE